MRSVKDDPRPDDVDTGDSAELTLNVSFPVGTSEAWVKVQRMAYARPGETAEELRDRVDRVTFNHLANAHDSLNKMLGRS